MPDARNIDDARLFRSEDLRHQQVCEQEMRKMVRSKLRLEAVFGYAVGTGHDGGIVDHDIDVGDVFIGDDLRCGYADAREGVEGDGEEFDEGGGGERLDGVNNGLDLGK